MKQFRPQRGSFEESMNESVYVNPLTAETLGWVLGLFDIHAQYADITLQPYCYDERNKWNTYVVLVNGQAVGFTDGPYDPASLSWALAGNTAMSSGFLEVLKNKP